MGEKWTSRRAFILAAIYNRLTAKIVFGWLVFLIVITSRFILNTILKRNKNGRTILELNNQEPKRDKINE